MFSINRRGYYARSYDPMVRYVIKELHRKKLEGYVMLMFLQLQGSVTMGISCSCTCTSVCS